MNNEKIAQLLETLITEVRKGNQMQDPVSADQMARDSLRSSVTEKNKEDDDKRKELRQASLSAFKVGNAVLNQGLGFANSGDYRQAIGGMGMAAGGLAGMAFGNTMKGAQIGSAVASTATEIGQLFAPRGYNMFNMYEKHDRTVTEPYKQVENYVGQMAYYGVDVSPEDQKAIMGQLQEASQRSYSAIQRTRRELSGQTAAANTLWEQTKDGFSGLWHFVAGEGHEATMREAMKQRKKINAVMRQNRLDDNY